MKVSLVSITRPHLDGVVQTPEEHIVYLARVSNPANQHKNETAPKLIKYLIEHKHWSPFEMVDLTFCIVTSRAVSAQLLRHRSAVFQEFSQRYAAVTETEQVELRLQGRSNRQVGDVTITDKTLNRNVKDHLKASMQLYADLISQGVAKESARFVLPMAATTTLYMKNNVRNWIHYIELRTKENTQKEHRQVAEAIKTIFVGIFPTIAEVLLW